MNNKLLKNTAIVIGCSMAAKLFSFVWEAILAAFVGTSDQADAFYMTSSIFGILYPILDVGIWKVFLPLYKTKMVQSGEEHSRRIADIVLSLFFCLSVGLVLFLVVLAEPLSWLSAPGFSAEKRTLTIQYIRLSAPACLLMTSASVVGAILQCHGRFLGSQLRELGSHISKIIFVLLCYRYMGIYAAVFAMVVGSIFRLLIQLPFVRWNWRFRPDFHFGDPDIRQMIRELPAVALTAAISHINGLVDRIIASGVMTGAVACLHYGHKLMNVFSGMVSGAISTAAYPVMVQYISEKRTDKLRELLSSVIDVLAFFSIPVSVFCILFSGDIVTIAFQRGAFEAAATALTARVFAGYSVGMLFVGISGILSNVFYGYGDTRSVLGISILNIVLNLGCNLVFCRIWDVAGLALATSVSAGICFALRLILMKKYRILDHKYLLGEVLKITMISVIAIAGMFGVLEGFGIANGYVRVFGGMVISTAVYLTLAKLFRISAMYHVLSLLRKKPGNKTV